MLAGLDTAVFVSVPRHPLSGVSRQVLQITEVGCVLLPPSLPEKRIIVSQLSRNFPGQVAFALFLKSFELSCFFKE